MSRATSESRLRWPARWLNATLRGAAGVGIRQRPIVADDLIRAARRRTGLHDLGDGDPEGTLNILARSFDTETGLSPFGRILVRGLLRDVIEQRLKIIDTLKRHRSILDVEIRRPVFVIGFPRTGTTLTYNLLAQDPEARALLTWESAKPTPPPTWETRDADPRARQVARAIRVANYLVPEFKQVHELRADGPEECQRLLRHTLITAAFSLNGDIPTYLDWVRSLGPDELRAAYGFYRNQLQLLQWRCARGHWVLKSPYHLQYLGVILDVFPDACIVQTHRDPADALPSLCSLGAVAHKVFLERPDPHRLGRRLTDGAVQVLERAMELRERIPAERVIDVRYKDLVANPAGVIERIYSHFGLEVSSAMGQGMAAWQRANPQHKHGRHRYSLEQFGLDRDEIDRLFEPYRRRFGLTDDGAAASATPAGNA